MSPNPDRAARRPRVRASPVLLAATLLGACVPGRPAVVGPVPDARAAAEALREQTRVRQPLQIVFGWRANDQGVRARGRGAARVAPPARARLDLFLENGETAMRAALVDSEIRVPPGAPAEVLPPADLLWAALGVVHPSPGATFAGGDRLEDGSLRLRYEYRDGAELQYRLSSGRLIGVDVVRDGSVVEELTLVPGADGPRPAEATYRHHTDFRELSLVRESVDTVSAFPEEIWSPSR